MKQIKQTFWGEENPILTLKTFEQPSTKLPSFLGKPYVSIFLFDFAKVFGNLPFYIQKSFSLIFVSDLRF